MPETGTSLSEVYDLFMQTVTDYRLLTLFDQSLVDFETFLNAWLKFSIAEFSDICDQDLTYSDTTNTFDVTLSTQNQVILATLMMKYWLRKNVNDITQMNLHVTDRDFKVASEALNLKEKAAYLVIIEEKCSQLLNDYSYKRADWADWYQQEFAG